MPRKSKATIEKEQEQKRQSNKTKWLIISIISFTLMVLVFIKMGKFGTVTNNILTLIFGSLYIVLLLTVFFYGIVTVFLSHKLNRSIRVILGLILLNLWIELIGSYICNEISDFNSYTQYLLNSFNSVLANESIAFTGGIVGNFIYMLLTLGFDREGTLIVILSLSIVILVLVIPGSLYSKWFNDIKQHFANKKIEKQKRKEEKLLQKQKDEELEEERRLKQAEEFARMNESIQEEEPVVEVKPRKITHPEVLSTKSKFFINLDTDQNLDTNDSVSNKEDIEIIQEVKEKRNTTLRVKKKNGTYHLPPVSLLNQAKGKASNKNVEIAKKKGTHLIEVLKTFDINSTLVNTHIGPSVTKFEIKPESTVKISRIQNIADNIKMELAAKEVRIEAPIPGRNAVGVEIPNVESTLVSMYDMISKVPASLKQKKLLFTLGKDLMGKEVYCDLEKMPHLLIAGATGSGKSVCENAIITSYIMRSNPDELKLVLIDPKKVEFTPYHDIPHLLWPVITDVTMASNMLKKLVAIMEDRYEAFSTVSVKNIQTFNEFVDNHNANLKANESPMEKLPYIVVVIDELADMMAVAGKDVEVSIQRIAQLARASGIHLIIATQRPSTDVITGLIKNNMPSRISFALTSQIDSRTIIDQAGAEKLLGNGDMLYKPQDENAPIRLQGVYVTEDEVSKICNYAKSQAEPEYEDSYFEFQRLANSDVVGSSALNADTTDSLYDEVIEFVRQRQAASTSLLQRRFGIGYNRAARLIDTLEDKGLIGPANGSKPREVYLKKDDEN